MRKYLTLLIALCICFVAQGKKWHPNSEKQKRERRVQIFQTAAANNIAHKSTALQERLIASSYYIDTGNNALVFYDSSKHVYNTNHRGSSYNYVFMNYGETYDAMYDVMAGYWINQLLVKADTTTYYIVDTNIELWSTTYRNYNTDYNVTDTRLEIVGMTDTTLRLFFHTGQLLDSVLELYYNGINWDTTFKRYMTYDGNDNLVQDSLYSWNGVSYDPYNKYVYKRDLQGNVSEFEIYNWDVSNLAWDIASIDSNIYNGNNQLVLMKSYYDINSNDVLVLTGKDTFMYTTGADVATMRLGYLWDGMNNQFEDFYKEQRILNTAMNPDTIFRSLWNGSNWDTSTVEKYMYTAMDNPEHKYIYVDSLSAVPDEAYHYYYGQYDPASVKEVVKEDDILIYPNPASNMVTIELKKEGKYSLELLNASGQVVRRESLNGKKTEISLKNLSGGMYWLVIGGEKTYVRPIVKE